MMNDFLDFLGTSTDYAVHQNLLSDELTPQEAMSSLGGESETTAKADQLVSSIHNQLDALATQEEEEEEGQKQELDTTGGEQEQAEVTGGAGRGKKKKAPKEPKVAKEKKKRKF
jgi:hypothetical protein